MQRCSVHSGVVEVWNDFWHKYTTCLFSVIMNVTHINVCTLSHHTPKDKRVRCDKQSASRVSWTSRGVLLGGRLYNGSPYAIGPLSVLSMMLVCCAQRLDGSSYYLALDMIHMTITKWNGPCPLWPRSPLSATAELLLYLSSPPVGSPLVCYAPTQLACAAAVEGLGEFDRLSWTDVPSRSKTTTQLTKFKQSQLSTVKLMYSQSNSRNQHSDSLCFNSADYMIVSTDCCRNRLSCIV